MMLLKKILLLVQASALACYAFVNNYDRVISQLNEGSWKGYSGVLSMIFFGIGISLAAYLVVTE